MKRSRLPLTALRSFEAAGRLMSFTRAAEELCISQAAISRQVRELEVLLDRPLFDRGHRSVRLTQEGAKLLHVVTASFDAMSDGLADVERGKGPDTVNINAEPSFAACFLTPHLSDFQRSHPDIDVRVESESALAEFRHNEDVVAIRHSLTRTSWPRSESRHLMDVQMTPCLSPRLMEGRAAPQRPVDLLDFPLLYEDSRDMWRSWFERAGVSSDVYPRGPIYTDEGMTLQAALRGQGVALLEERFAREYLASGLLIRPFQQTLPFGAFFIVVRGFETLAPAAHNFLEWLSESVRSRDGH
ncbi:LysR substrate-binding domain-containing protein [Rhizobium rhizogenes]|uniref:Transcriptional regulator n=1 Tax=Rhizobium rhizogenes TaxID=359 RepID=A0AA92C2T6_RHIRH|nr:transcriptional regulator [Rhizobium rhizogenes]PVE66347.1 transcriptional regulator [Agrobacterium tumefaciens]PVE76335.1 transcriptional regulator [Sphingomonas sp. TPD3009]